MEQNHSDLIILDNPNTERRTLLPLWIKIFTWLFMLFGAIVPIALVWGFIGNSFHLSIYGLETQDPLSVTGFAILSLFTFKAIVAYGLWSKKKWAIEVGIYDAVIGIIICGYIMILAPFLSTEKGFTLNFRLEIILLILYLLKLLRLKKVW